MPKSPALQPLPEHLIVGRAGKYTAASKADSAERSFKPIPRGYLIPLGHLSPWERQPRRSVDDDGLDELAVSIAETGVLEPLVVRRDAERPGYYIIIAGHRRYLAARRVHAGANQEARTAVEALPCIVREATDASAFADALVENLVRTDLTRREVMDALVALQTEYGWSGRAIAKRTGRQQSDVNDMLRVAKHPVLYQLVSEERVAPSVAGRVFRLPDAQQETIITRLAGGERFTAKDVERIAETARRGDASRHEAFPPPEQSRAEDIMGQAVTSSDTVGRTETSPSVAQVVDEVARSQRPQHVSHSDAGCLNSDTSTTINSDGMVGAYAVQAAARVDGGERVVVGQHTRRKAGSSAPYRPTTDEVQRVARDIVMMAAETTVLDAAAVTMLREAATELLRRLNALTARA